MRILEVTTDGVAGVPDCTLTLPELPVTALAGANGTGKTKMLGCMLSPWSPALPTDQESRAEIRVRLRLSPAEQQALKDLSVEAEWGQADVPDEFSVNVRHTPNTGTRRTAEPRIPVLDRLFSQNAFLQRHSSFNVIYLPAERRLVAAGQQAIDLNQLTALLAWQRTAESRNAIRNQGRLDDQEFEQYAKALCVAASLPDEDETDTGAEIARIQWEEFKRTVDSLISPKWLVPLTRQRPDQLRIGTPSGQFHEVSGLSSGERQALVIISRVMRAGAGHTIVVVDEPDAFLHPHLSQRLMDALTLGIGPTGQLIVATHSPAILDKLPPTGIVRLQHSEAPRLVADEADRVELYRSAGFRASALTQSDLLIIVEGEGDVALLELLFPDLARAAIHSAGSRARVFREVEQLSPYELPVLGVVDGDVYAVHQQSLTSDRVVVWPTADIEGLMLSSDEVLQAMIDLGLLTAEFPTVESARALLDTLLQNERDNVIAELAQLRLRTQAEMEWPTPRGNEPIERLRGAIEDMTMPTGDDVDRAIEGAWTVWNQHNADLWRLVRGKRVLPTFTSRASEMRSGRALLESVARTQPSVQGLAEFEAKLMAALA